MFPLVLFAIVAAACIAGSFWLIGGDYPLLLVKHGGYWILLATFGLFLFSVYKNRAVHFRNPQGFIIQHKWAVCVSGVFVGLYFLLQEPWFKITMDEIVLASTSMHMHLEKEVFTASRGYEVNGVYYLLGGYLDKRPYFFAFLVSLVHDLFGYRSSNVFYFNAVVSFVFILGVYLVGSLLGGKRWGWISMLLLLSIPLFGLNVTGGGFEIFNLLMILLCCYFGKCWLEQPNESNLVSFVYSGILLAQCRYESILFVFPVGALVLFVWWREKTVVLPWPLFFAPFALMPYVLQNRVLNESKVLWQLNENQAAPFGVEYLSQNIGSAMDFFLQVGNDQGNSLLLFALTVVCMVLELIYLFHFRAYYPLEKTGWRLVAWLFGLTIVINFGLLMFYYWGQINDPVATRLSLPLHLALLIFCVFVLSRIPWSAFMFRFSLLAGLSCLWFLTLPNLNQSRYMRLAYDAREIKWVRSIIEEREGPLLVIFNHHIAAIIEGISAVPVGYSTTRKAELAFHLKNQTFSEVLVVNRESDSVSADNRTFESVQIKQLGEHFELMPLDSYRLGPGDVTHIHLVKRVILSEEDQSIYQANLAEFASASNKPGEDLTAYFSKWLP